MFSGWCSVTLPGSEIDVGGVRTLERSFRLAYVKARNPKGACLFVHKFADNQFYFSPKAEKFSRLILAMYGGFNCKPPKRSDLEFIAGSRLLNEVHFAPEQENGRPDAEIRLFPRLTQI